MKKISITYLWTRLTALFMILVIMLSFTSCATDTTPDSHGNVRVTDDLERVVSVKKAPKRVACLLGSFADIWCLAGGEVCATAEDAWEDFGFSGDAVSIGGAHSPSVELLLSSEPELVIASAATASNVEMRELLESVNIPVIYFDVISFEDYLEMLNICTDITGRKDLFEKNGLKIKEQIDEIKSQLSDGKIPSEKRKILLLRASSTSVKAKGSYGTVLGEMLESLGCINIADSDGSLLESLSAEAIIKDPPYRIFVVTMGSNTAKAEEAVMSVINENPAIASLDAVRLGRIHFMDKALFNLKPNDRWGEAYATLCQILTEET